MTNRWQFAALALALALGGCADLFDVCKPVNGRVPSTCWSVG